MSFRFLFKSSPLRLYRPYSVAQTPPLADVRNELLAAVKAAMKSKDAFASTTLRGVLAEVYSADKAANKQVTSSAICSILRKATARRIDSAAQYTAHARPELAEKEISEADLLSRFLPPLLSEADIDQNLQKILADLPKPPKAGDVFKLFYSTVDKATVDSQKVKQRLDELLKGL